MGKKFSVSMCVYGGDNAEWFHRAIESLLSQSVLPDEIVLVVDGPVPPELDAKILFCKQNPIFKVIRLETNQGHGIARKTGLSNCHNDLIAIMDADDVSMPGRFEKQLAAFDENEDLDIVGGMITEFIDDESNVVGRRIVPADDAEIKKFMKKRCPMNLVTVMFKKNSVEAVGGFIDWYCEEDYYLWLRMAQEEMKFANVSDVLVNVRVGKDMYQRRGGMKYFRSEKKLQKYMRKNKIIGFGTYIVNVTERFVLQVLMPNQLRGWIFRKFARKNSMSEKKYKIGYTTGVFDMFHIGHLNILKRAKEQCEYLIVGVTTDELCYKRKQKYPIICENDRMEIVSAIKYVDRVVPQSDMDKIKPVKEYGIDAVFVGSDWKGTPSWIEYEKEFAKEGCTVMYLDHTDGISSTILRERLNDSEKPL